MKHPKKGDVWRYEYLWRREHDVGIETGLKTRRTALVATFLGSDGRTNLFWIPITSKKPFSDRVSVEIPQIEKKRAGLTMHMPLWVILDEYNHEFLETSFYFDPNGYQGAFSSVFTEKILGLLIEIGREGRLQKVPRHDK